ncbi:SPOR domain-containing protein [Craterilacuibacter sp.]|uniref:SPOR domain-containing protein n=1 Tax=Craterilacuibacter sp. TaxID=2870909 RepID=UPI003F40B5D8
MSGLSTEQELIQLRKRARRRLVGAVVLVSVSTIVLWNIVGAIPDQKMKPEAIAVIGQTATQAASAPLAATHTDASDAIASAAPAASSPTEIVASLPNLDEAVLPADVAPATAAPKLIAPQTVATPVKPVPKAETIVRAEVAKPVVKAEVAKPAPVERDPLAILEGRDTHAPAKAEAPKSGRFMVQLAALGDPAKVDALRERLAANGMSAQFSQVKTSKGDVVRVRMGPYASQAEAQAALARLSKAGVSGMVVSAK